MSKPPVRYSSDVEQIGPDEGKTIAEINETFDSILETTANDYGHAVRSVHAKGHGLLEGTLEIDANLPPELAQGLFAEPGRYKVYMRLSTNAGDILPDEISLPRGLAIKVVGAPGERLSGAEGKSQDFVMVNGPVFQSKTADKFLTSLKLVAKTTNRIEGTKKVVSAILRGINTALSAVGVESSTVQTLGGAPNVDPLGETYFSVTPFRYGDYIAKFSLAPIAPSLTAFKGTEIDAKNRPDAIREHVREEMATIDAVWELRVQLCRDLEKQSVEDPTVEWKEKDTPFERVGVITARHQDSWSANLLQLVDEEMRFSVWTGLAAHRPLGNINRARKAPYDHSAAFRQRFNGCPIREPEAAPVMAKSTSPPG